MSVYIGPCMTSLAGLNIPAFGIYEELVAGKWSFVDDYQVEYKASFSSSFMSTVIQTENQITMSDEFQAKSKANDAAGQLRELLYMRQLFCPLQAAY